MHRRLSMQLRTGLAVRRLSEQPLDQHAVHPLAVELAVAALHADLGEPCAAVSGAAGLVGSEDAAGELVEPGRLCLPGERLQQAPSKAPATGRRVDVDGMLADAGGTQRSE